MPSIEQSGRTVDEAVEVALKALGVSREEVEVEVLAKESRGLLGILGTTEARVRVTTVSADAAADAAPDAAPDAVPAAGADAQSDAGPDVSPGLTGPGLSDVSVLAQRAVELLTKMLAYMDIPGETRVTSDDAEGVCIEIYNCPNAGLVIGKRGQTLAALQLLVAMMTNRSQPLEERRRIILDAEGYRGRRERTLQSMASSGAARAKRSGREVTLEALDPRERRIVHLALADDPGVTTRSEGEDPNRSVVIIPRGEA